MSIIDFIFNVVRRIFIIILIFICLILLSIYFWFSGSAGSEIILGIMCVPAVLINVLMKKTTHNSPT